MRPRCLVGSTRFPQPYGQARQAAQDGLVAQVGQLNKALGQVGNLSDQIVVLKAQGIGTADLENQRNAVTAQISQLVNARFVEQPNGDLQVITSGGAQLPTRTPNPLSISDARVGPGVFYPGGALPGVTLDGTDITKQLTGGQNRGECDAARYHSAGLPGSAGRVLQRIGIALRCSGAHLVHERPRVSTGDGRGRPVQSGYLGFASTITVNPAIVQDPALVRDGTRSVVAGEPGGGSPYTPNPQGLAGFSGLNQPRAQLRLWPGFSGIDYTTGHRHERAGRQWDLVGAILVPRDFGASLPTAITSSQAGRQCAGHQRQHRHNRGADRLAEPADRRDRSQHRHGVIPSDRLAECLLGQR